MSFRVPWLVRLGQPEPVLFTDWVAIFDFHVFSPELLGSHYFARDFAGYFHSNVRNFTEQSKKQVLAPVCDTIWALNF